MLKFIFKNWRSQLVETKYQMVSSSITAVRPQKGIAISNLKCINGGGQQVQS